MKVLFTRPNSQMTMAPAPLGLGYLSHAVKTMRGDQTMIIDGRNRRLSPDAILSQAASFEPDVIGVTALTFDAPEALDLICRFKARWSEVPVILGGPHTTGYGPSLLSQTQADYLIMGEGEDTLVELLDALEGKRDLANIKGVARRVDGEAVYSGVREPIEDMERLGIDWEAIKPDEYFDWLGRNAMNTIARSSRRLPLFFSRGCPFGCSYCHHIFGRKYRPFPVERTVAEMVRLRDQYNLKEFEIQDDSFNVNLSHTKAVMDEIIARKLLTKLTFTNGLRADLMDEELLDLMIRAGTYRINYAIESASPRIQKLVHKNLDLDRARQVVNMTADKGIVTGVYFMLGFPGESEQEMEQTIEYALTLRNHIVSFFYLLPFPGTQIAESNPELSKKTRELALNFASELMINLSGVSDPVLRKMRKTGYRRFYFSGSRILRIARDVPKTPRTLVSALVAIRLSFQEGVKI